MASAKQRRSGANGGDTHRRRTFPSRSATTDSHLSLISQPESLILPDGPIGVEAAELLEEFVNPHQQSRGHGLETTLVVTDEPTGLEQEDLDLDKGPDISWWKRPSPWWYVRPIFNP